MRINRSREHLADEALVAYLDGEMSNTRMRAIRTHLNLCWKCRSAVAELESQAEAISRLLTEKSKNEIDRSLQAREKFLRWRNAFEGRRRFFFMPAASIVEECRRRGACIVRSVLCSASAPERV